MIAPANASRKVLSADGSSAAVIWPTIALLPLPRPPISLATRPTRVNGLGDLVAVPGGTLTPPHERHPMNPSSNLDVEHARAWTHRRLRLGHAARDPLVALRDVVAVYSAHPMAPLALAARTRAFDADAFAALEARKRAVRVVGMRGSGFLVPADLVDNIVAATRRTLGAGQLRARGLDEGTYAALKPRILKALRKPVTPSELRDALGAAAGDQAPYFAMRLMAREGLVVRVGTGRIRTDDLRWVATEAHLGKPIGDADEADALRWLARTYLDRYGPARIEDFAWWAGVPVRRAREAIEAVDAAEVSAGHLVPSSARAAWEAQEPLDSDAIDVLPKWDPYTMGFAPDGRDRQVDRKHLRFAYTTGETRVGATSGDGLPLVLRGGRAVATWSHRLSGRRMPVEVMPFANGGSASRDIVELARPEFEEIGVLMEAEVELTLARRP